MIKFNVTVFDAHLNTEDNQIATKAAVTALSNYPTWLLKAICDDHDASINEGVTHFEDGQSAWNKIISEAESAVVDALGFSPAGASGVGKGSGWHLEVEFHN